MRNGLWANAMTVEASSYSMGRLTSMSRATRPRPHMTANEASSVPLRLRSLRSATNWRESGGSEDWSEVRREGLKCAVGGESIRDRLERKVRDERQAEQHQPENGRESGKYPHQSFPGRCHCSQP